MRILLINQYAGGPSLGMEYRPHWMARRWQERGHEVLVVCGDRSHLRTTAKIDRGRRLYEGVRFQVLPTTPYKANGPARFANLLSFGAVLGWSHPRLARFEPDVVIASSTHPFDVRPALRLARATGARFVYEVHDLWPLTPILLGGVSQEHPAIRLMQREERFAYLNADLVVSLLPKTEGYMRSRGLAEGRWIWIPNGVEFSPRTATPSPSAALRSVQAGVAELRRSYPVVLVYAGAHGTANALEDLLDSAGSAEQLGIAFALVGSGLLKEDLQARCADCPNVRFFDPVPRSEVTQALRLADFAYAGARPSPLYRFGVSFNKIYDYLAAGLPLLENIGAANSPVADAACGLAADPNVPESLIEALRQMAQSSAEERATWGQNGRTYVEQHMRQEVLADQMLDAMRDATPRC